MAPVSVASVIGAVRSAARNQQTAQQERVGPCSVQSHIHDLVFTDVEVGSQLSSLPHPLRDSAFRTSRTVLYGGGYGSSCAYKKEEPQLQSLQILGSCVMRTMQTCSGAVICSTNPYTNIPGVLRDDLENVGLYLLIPSAPLAMLEQEFLSRETLSEFENSWAGPSIENRSLLCGMHSALAQHMRGIAAHALPFDVFGGAHNLEIGGAVPWMSISTPETPKEMHTAATALRIAIAWNGIQTSADTDDDDFTSYFLPKLIERLKISTAPLNLKSIFVQLDSRASGRITASMSNVDTEKIEDLLLRSVCTHLGVVLALRMDSPSISGGESSELISSLITQKSVHLTDSTKTQLDASMHKIVAEENRQRLTLASTSASFLQNPMLCPLLGEIMSQLPRITFLQELLDIEQFSELPSALAVFFERGFCSSELLRTKYRSNMDEYLAVIGCMLCCRSAIVLVNCDATDRPNELKVFSQNGQVSLRPCDLPRMAFAPWTLVLVKTSNQIGVVRSNGIEKELLAFSSSARQKMARLVPDMAPLAERLLAELRETRERVDVLLSPSGASAREEFARRRTDDVPIVKKLKANMNFFTKMAAN